MQSARITPAYAGKSVCFFLILSKIMGSPPPMRGKGQGVLHFISPFRITPAYAGKSTILMQIFQMATGSPPPMRGKASTCALVLSSFRITPAYAGKRLHQGRSHLLYQDHPRLCGEKSRLIWTAHPMQGSPPPMRGKVICLKDTSPCSRITPAYAGKRSGTDLYRIENKDHPRLCGEKRIWTQTSQPDTGSPPPMRGKVQLFPQVPQWTGITPAYAGKSFRKTAVRHAIKDHPRLCGEKLQETADFTHVAGSPPPMRGKVTGYSAIDSRLRITPAYAGKSCRS